MIDPRHVQDAAARRQSRRLQWITAAFVALIAIVGVIVIVIADPPPDEFAYEEDEYAYIEDPLTAEQISALLEVIDEKIDVDRYSAVWIYADATAMVAVCEEPDVAAYYYVDEFGEVMDDGDSYEPCSGGFSLDELDPAILAQLQELNTTYEQPPIISVDSWGTLTPVISFETDDGSIVEYDVAGNELGPVIDPTKADERAMAIKALEDASGITLVASICIETRLDTITLIGDSPQGLQAWQYTNTAKRLDVWSVGPGRLELRAYDLQAQLDFGTTIKDKYWSDKSKLASVCLDATYQQDAVVARYLYSKSFSEDYTHEVIATLDGQILQED